MKSDLQKTSVFYQEGAFMNKLAENSVFVDKNDTLMCHNIENCSSNN